MEKYKFSNYKGTCYLFAKFLVWMKMSPSPYLFYFVHHIWFWTRWIDWSRAPVRRKQVKEYVFYFEKIPMPWARIVTLKLYSVRIFSVYIIFNNFKMVTYANSTIVAEDFWGLSGAHSRRKKKEISFKTLFTWRVYRPGGRLNLNPKELWKEWSMIVPSQRICNRSFDWTYCNIKIYNVRQKSTVSLSKTTYTKGIEISIAQFKSLLPYKLSPIEIVALVLQLGMEVYATHLWLDFILPWGIIEGKTNTVFINLDHCYSTGDNLDVLQIVMYRMNSIA